MDIFKQYATDETLENNGTWHDIGHGASLLVARTGNTAYGKLLTKLYERNAKVLELKDEVAEAKSQEIMVEVMATTVLLGWKGVSYKGQPMDYSVENAKTLLAHKDFRRLVNTLSDDMENFRLREEKVQGEV